MDSSAANGWYIMQGSASTIAAYIKGVQTGAASGTINNGVWHHVALCYDGTYGYFFVDGVLRGSPTSIACLQATSANAVIGGLKYGGSVLGTYSAGQIDEFLTSSVCKWTANFTPPSAPYTNNVANGTALLHMDGNATDSYSLAQPETLAAAGAAAASLTAIATQLKTLAATAAASASAVVSTAPYNGVATGMSYSASGVKSGFGQYGVFNGSTSVIDLSANVPPAMNAATGTAFTINGWFQFSNAGVGMYLASAFDGSGNGWGVVTASAGRLALTGGWSAATSGAVNDGTWRQWELGFDGSKFYFFNNGTLVNTGGTSGTWTHLASPGVMFGAYKLGSGGTPGSYFTGNQDEIACFSGVCLHTASFTPPSSPWANNVTNGQAIYHLDGNATDSYSVSSSTPQPETLAATGASTAALTPLELQAESIAATADATATLTELTRQILSITASGTGTAGLTPTETQAAVLSASAAASAALAVQALAPTTLSGVATTAAALSATITQLVTMAAAGTSGAGLTVQPLAPQTLASIASAALTLTPTLLQTEALSSGASAAATITPALLQSVALSALGNAAASLAASTSQALALPANAASSAALAVLLSQSETLAATATAQAELGTGGQMPVNLAAQASATAGLVPGLTVGEALAATSNATAALSETLRQSIVGGLNAVSGANAALIVASTQLVGSLFASAQSIATMAVDAAPPALQLRTTADAIAALTPLLKQYLSLSATAHTSALLHLVPPVLPRVRVLSMSLVPGVRATIVSIPGVRATIAELAV